MEGGVSGISKGLSVSRKGCFNLSCVTTFDLRMREPYADGSMTSSVAHTLEHCLGTYLRDLRRDVIYVGAMGSLTGMRLVVAGDKEVANVRTSVIEALERVARTNEIPHATDAECGNRDMMDLYGARDEAAAFIRFLKA